MKSDWDGRRLANASVGTELLGFEVEEFIVVARPGYSRKLEGILYVDAEIANGALNLCRPSKICTAADCQPNRTSRG